MRRSLPVLFGLFAAFALPHLSLAQESTTVGGYGEIHYQNPSGDAPGTANVTRFVLYLAHAFNDRLTFHSELEVEDAKVEGGESGGEVAVEQAFLDYRLSPALTFRSGLVLIPVGFLNEVHEPTTFNGVERPIFDHDVIPATWREIGVGAVGNVPGVEGLGYKLYLVNGLRAEEFSADDGIRGGRGEGQEASFQNPSLTGRLAWSRPGLEIGGSFWHGGTADGTPELGTDPWSAPITVLALDGRFDWGPWALRGEAANVSVHDAEEIDQAFGNDVGSRINGGYAEVAYDLLHLLAPNSSQRLNAFVRHARFDLHADVPAGVTRDPSLAHRITTFGLTYKPTYNTAFKGDYQVLRNRGGQDQQEVFSLGIGYQF